MRDKQGENEKQKSQSAVDCELIDGGFQVNDNKMDANDYPKDKSPVMPGLIEQGAIDSSPIAARDILFKSKYLKIEETEYHTLNKIEAMIRRCNPSIIVLESEKPSINNRVLRHARYLTRSGWFQVSLKTITRHRKTKEGTKEFDVISVMLSKSKC